MSAFYDNVREITRLNEHITKQDAKVERLRAALKEIAENSHDVEACAFAREALRAIGQSELE